MLRFRFRSLAFGIAGICIAFGLVAHARVSHQIAVESLGKLGARFRYPERDYLGVDFIWPTWSRDKFGIVTYRELFFYNGKIGQDESRLLNDLIGLEFAVFYRTDFTKTFDRMPSKVCDIAFVNTTWNKSVVDALCEHGNLRWINLESIEVGVDDVTRILRSNPFATMEVCGTPIASSKKQELKAEFVNRFEWSIARVLDTTETLNKTLSLYRYPVPRGQTQETKEETKVSGTELAK